MSVRSAGGEDLFPIDEAVARRVISEGVPVALSGGAESVLAVKEGETFMLTGQAGDIEEATGRGLGFYHRDTRFLSVYTMRINGMRPVLLSSTADPGYLVQIDLTNPDVFAGEDVIAIPQQTVSLRRTRVLGRRLHERIRVKNHSAQPVNLAIELVVGSDFFDLFEVRGLRRSIRGTILTPQVTDRTITLAYLGRDDLYRRTEIQLSHQPTSAVVKKDRVAVTFTVPLQPRQTQLLGLSIEPVVGGAAPRDDFDGTLHRLRRSYEDWDRECTRIRTDNEIFDRLLERGRRDLRALYTPAEIGSVIAAGIPWGVAVCGRDAILAAYEVLPVNPRVAAEALTTLVRYQGRQSDPWRDEEPGKIPSEVRQGELAISNQVPHAPYYGAVDTTPMFCMLAAAYFRWTNDRALIDRLKPALRSALEWIDVYGDQDGDGFVEYVRRSPRGLENQGWKDTGGAILHDDGSPAEPPIALAEIQGYVYMAKQRLGELFRLTGEAEEGSRLIKEAEVLKDRFNSEFWMPEEGYYALALDGQKRPVRTITSNPGHGFYCGIVDDDKAESVCRRLLQPDMFSGWGIRTMSKGAAGYNPVSYHNGSVWPHDNAIIAAGLKRYGFHDATNRVATALFDAATEMEYMRLPELFCGYTRRSRNRPVAYPVASAPHAVAAGSVFIMLQAMLGISARAHENLLTVNAPYLPSWLRSVEIDNLRVGGSRISMLFTRDGDVTSFSLLSKEGDVRVVMEE